MRLIQPTIDSITHATRHILGSDAQVWLFGSQVDDDIRGGDIDLLIETTQALNNPVSSVCQISAQIQLSIGLQRIDIVLKDANTKATPIHDIAKSHGVRLC